MSCTHKNSPPAKGEYAEGGRGLIPRLRFPEFRDMGEWEEKTLTQISRAIFDGTHQTPTYTQDGIPFFSVENIVSGKINKFISKEDYLSSTSKNKPEKGDILITRIGKIGFSAIVEWGYEFSIYVTLAVIKKAACFDSHYLHAFLQSERYQAEILSKSLLNAVPCKINMDELRKTRVLLPSLPEQQKIADCLSSLDALIAAQTEKIDALKTHKKGLMQQLFPREGETIPRLRFPEFRDAGEWIKRSLSNVARITQGGTPSTGVASYWGGTVRWITPAEMGKTETPFISDTIRTITEEGLKNCSSELLPANSIVLSTRAPIGHLAINKVPMAINQGCRGLIPKRETNYLFLCSSLARYKIQLENFGAGNTFKELSGNALKSFVVPVPHLAEQQKIADCLSSLDDLIAAHSDKLTALKAHKKGLMQQLFPTADKVGA